MARVTVEDCVVKIPNRFELVMTAAQRAREIGAGAPLTVEKDNDKDPVVALREIAEETVSLEALGDALVKDFQKVQEPDEPEDEIIELMAGEEEWLRATSSPELGAAAGDLVVEGIVADTAEATEGTEDRPAEATADDGTDSAEDSADGGTDSAEDSADGGTDAAEEIADGLAGAAGDNGGDDAAGGEDKDLA